MTWDEIENEVRDTLLDGRRWKLLVNAPDWLRVAADEIFRLRFKDQMEAAGKVIFHVDRLPPAEVLAAQIKEAHSVLDGLGAPEGSLAERLATFGGGK